MLNFNDISLADKVWVDELLGYSGFMGTEYCFTSLYIWDKIYNSKILHYKDFLLLRSVSKEMATYLYPAGRGDLKESIEMMIEDSKSIERRFLITSIPAEGKTKLEELFPERFEFISARNSFDYIYDRESLATLSGKRYQSKRNHIARFKELPDWEYERISVDDPNRLTGQIDECIEMNQEWCKINKCYDNNSLHNETCAATKALKNFAELKLLGGILRSGGKVVAFTIGEPLNSDTFIVHIEKAFSDIKGAYPFINQQFILHETEGYKYINREDDAGDEGLRKAKLSYHPVLMVEKYIAKEK